MVLRAHWAVLRQRISLALDSWEIVFFGYGGVFILPFEGGARIKHGLVDEEMNDFVDDFAGAARLNGSH